MSNLTQAGQGIPLDFAEQSVSSFTHDHTGSRGAPESTPGKDYQRERIKIFLRAICEQPNITKAVKAAGIERRTHYDWLANVPGYAEAFEKAQKMGWGSLESEAVRRAQEGYARPIYQAGRLVGEETVYSDRLTEVLLKGNIAKYKDAAPAAAGISIQLAIGLLPGQQQPVAAVVTPAIEVQALPAAEEPRAFDLSILPAATSPAP